MEITSFIEVANHFGLSQLMTCEKTKQVNSMVKVIEFRGCRVEILEEQKFACIVYPSSKAPSFVSGADFDSMMSVISK